MEPRAITIVASGAGRLDLAIAENGAVSRREAKRLLQAGRVVVEGEICRVASRSVAKGSRISLVRDGNEIIVLQEKRGWVAVDKPSGMHVQPAREQGEPSLLERVVVRTGGAVHPVHRLDHGASGVVLFATSKQGAASLGRLFAERSIEKTYLAMVHGAAPGEIVIDEPIGRVGDGWGISPDGRPARSAVRRVGGSGEMSLVEVTIETGRTHQIRIHLAGIGHPVAGDRRYGRNDDAERLMLHAAMLSHRSIGTIRSPLPAQFTTLARRYGFEAEIADTIRET